MLIVSSYLFLPLPHTILTSVIHDGSFLPAFPARQAEEMRSRVIADEKVVVALTEEPVIRIYLLEVGDRTLHFALGIE